jgi:Fe2+ transport system protein FeoA
MTINLAPLLVDLRVASFSPDEEREYSEIESRLMHLGFIHGAIVRVTRKAPFFLEPLLVEVRGRQIAMSYGEAAMVKVEVL